MSRRKNNPELTKAFGRAVRALRENSKLSQEAFAYSIGIERSHYGQIERGRKAPTIITLWRIAEGLGKQPRQIIEAVEIEFATEQKPETEKGARESKIPPAAKKTGKRLGYAGKTNQSGKITEPSGRS